MKRKLYLDIALLVVILGSIGVFIFMQHAPATDTSTQEVVDAPTTGCCGGASKVEGETSHGTAGGCCGTSTSDAEQSVDNSQQVQPLETPETDEIVTPTPASEDTNESGCGCGS